MINGLELLRAKFERADSEIMAHIRELLKAGSELEAKVAELEAKVAELEERENGLKFTVERKMELPEISIPVVLKPSSKTWCGGCRSGCDQCLCMPPTLGTN